MEAVSYIEALAITLALEVPAYAVGLAGALGSRPRTASIAGVVVNLLSHPLGFLVIAPLTAPVLGPTGSLAIVELFAWTGEAVLLWVWIRRAPTAIAMVSLLANSLSLLAGLALISWI
jgi:hypothetical protein